MGTPEFAVSVLKKLLQEKFELAAVITAPDKPAGRGRKLRTSAVKEFALSKNLKVLQPSNLKDPIFLEHLKSLQANLQIVVAFRMLPKAVWNLPELGTFNLHASLLPDYRGAAPINWALLNGETKTGVTTFFLDEKIDTGAILLQRETQIRDDETAGELHDKLMHLGSDLVIDTLRLIQQGKASPQKQAQKTVKIAPKIDADTCKIDWNESMENISNKIRGLDPYPAAWCILENGATKTTAKLFCAKKEFIQHNMPVGTVVTDKKNLRISAKGGFLNIGEIQLSGKKRMNAASLLNGYTFLKGAKVL